MLFHKQTRSVTQEHGACASMEGQIRSDAAQFVASVSLCLPVLLFFLTNSVSSLCASLALTLPLRDLFRDVRLLCVCVCMYCVLVCFDSIWRQVACTSTDLPHTETFFLSPGLLQLLGCSWDSLFGSRRSRNASDFLSFFFLPCPLFTLYISTFHCGRRYPSAVDPFLRVF